MAAGHGAWVRDMSAQSMLAAMRAAGIDRAIAMQAHGAYEYDNSYAADCAMQYPERLISVCVVDPLHREAPAQLTYWVKERGAQGLRLVALDRDSEWLDDPGTFPLWERAGALELPVCVCTRWRRVPRLRIALERFPSVSVALDHLGAPRLDEGPPYEGMRPLFELARYPNLVCEVLQRQPLRRRFLKEHAARVFHPSARLLWAGPADVGLELSSHIRSRAEGATRSGAGRIVVPSRGYAAQTVRRKQPGAVAGFALKAGERAGSRVRLPARREGELAGIAAPVSAVAPASVPVLFDSCGALKRARHAADDAVHTLIYVEADSDGHTRREG